MKLVGHTPNVQMLMNVILDYMIVMQTQYAQILTVVTVVNASAASTVMVKKIVPKLVMRNVSMVTVVRHLTINVSVILVGLDLTAAPTVDATIIQLVFMDQVSLLHRFI